MYQTSRMLTNTQQHIGQIVVHIDIMQSAGHYQALDNANMLSTDFGPTEQSISSTHRHGPERPLQMVRIQWHIRVFQEYPQRHFFAFYIANRFVEGSLGSSVRLCRVSSHHLKKQSTTGLLWVSRYWRFLSSESF